MDPMSGSATHRTGPLRIEIEWFDAGHSGAADEQLIAFQERLLRSAYRVLQQ
jgi:hypothetical protein